MSRIKTVAILSDVPKLCTALSKQLPSLQMIDVTSGTPETLKNLQKAEVIVADFNKIAEFIYQLKETKWIQGTWAGVEPIIREYGKTKEVPPCPIVRFSGDHFGAIICEYVVAQVTAFERDFARVWAAQQRKAWDQSGKIHDYKTFRDMEVGILGRGQIGSHISAVLKMLGARIWWFVRSNPAPTETFHADDYKKTSNIEEILDKCDLIINVLPHSPSTAGLLNARNLKCSRGALFVNVGRGSVVAEADLVEALNGKYLRGAILDVFAQEPLPTSSKLWDMPQVVITPHVAGLTRAKDVAEFFEKNLKLWESEGRLLNTIDFGKGY